MKDNENIIEAIRIVTTELKNTKKNIFKKILISFSIFSIIIFGIFFNIYLKYGIKSVHIYIIVLSLLLPVAVFMIIYNMNFAINSYQLYLKKFKEIFIDSVLLSIDKSFTYSIYAPSTEFYDDIGIIHYDAVLKREDFVTGIYKNINFKFCEICGDIQNNGIRSHLLICDFYKKFNDKIVIIPKEFVDSFKGSEKFENVEFNKKFHILAENKIEARYILTPSLIEKLNNLQDGKRNLHISSVFENDKFYLFLENDKNLFEPIEKFKPPTIELAEHFKKEFLEILSVIDELNLTLNIYPKTILKS